MDHCCSKTDTSRAITTIPTQQKENFNIVIIRLRVSFIFLIKFLLLDVYIVLPPKIGAEAFPSSSLFSLKRQRKTYSSIDQVDSEKFLTAMLAKDANDENDMRKVGHDVIGSTQRRITVQMDPQQILFSLSHDYLLSHNSNEDTNDDNGSSSIKWWWSLVLKKRLESPVATTKNGIWIVSFPHPSHHDSHNSLQENEEDFIPSVVVAHVEKTTTDEEEDNQEGKKITRKSGKIRLFANIRFRKGPLLEQFSQQGNMALTTEEKRAFLEGKEDESSKATDVDLLTKEGINHIFPQIIQFLTYSENHHDYDNGNSKRGDTILLSLSLSSLDRILIPSVKNALHKFGVDDVIVDPSRIPNNLKQRKTDTLQIKSTSIYACSLYVHRTTTAGINDHAFTLEDTQISKSRQQDGSTVNIRPLEVKDAKLVDSKWEYRSATSIHMIREAINHSDKIYERGGGGGGCFGVEVTEIDQRLDIIHDAKKNENEDRVLAAWVMRYLDGALGMLYTQENYRRKGYAEALLAHVMKKEKEALHYSQKDNNTDGGEREKEELSSFLFAFVVDGNVGSETLFETKMGWKRISAADWVSISCKINL